MDQQRKSGVSQSHLVAEELSLSYLPKQSRGEEVGEVLQGSRVEGSSLSLSQGAQTGKGLWVGSEEGQRAGAITLGGVCKGVCDPDLKPGSTPYSPCSSLSMLLNHPVCASGCSAVKWGQ